MSTITTAMYRRTAFKSLFLVFFFGIFTLAALAQEKLVSGTVRNAADGTPLANTTVQVKGTVIMTRSNESGAYSIRATEGQVLVFTAVGFAPAEEKVGRSSEINV